MNEVTVKCNSCRGDASVIHWQEKNKTHVYIECSCGIVTAERSSIDGERLLKDIIELFSRSKPRKLIKGTKLKSCFCGSKKLSLEQFDNSVYIVCYECYRTTDELNDDGSYKTVDQAIEVWNKENKENKEI